MLTKFKTNVLNLNLNLDLSPFEKSAPGFSERGGGGVGLSEALIFCTRIFHNEQFRSNCQFNGKSPCFTPVFTHNVYCVLVSWVIKTFLLGANRIKNIALMLFTVFVEHNSEFYNTSLIMAFPL